MSENDSTAPYDPDQDPDAQPASLNPREGAQASGDAASDADTDAEPANLNPRSTIDEPESGGEGGGEG
jgi:hypothetical protein